MQETYLRWPQVSTITGLSRTTIWRLEKGNEFPVRRRIGSRSVAWLQSEVSSWVDSRTQVRGRS